jgi:L-lactate dehydrogenase (cytochrome)
MKVELSGDEIAQHDSRKSCWIVIDSKVYDITPFIAQHPGGAAVLLKQAGSVCIKGVKTYSCDERVNSYFLAT